MHADAAMMRADGVEANADIDVQRHQSPCGVSWSPRR
jgi:hypothetical protein